jgi:hypothetical protein
LGIRPKLGFEIRLRSDGMIQFTGKPEDKQIFALWQRKNCPKNGFKTGLGCGPKKSSGDGIITRAL